MAGKREVNKMVEKKLKIILAGKDHINIRTLRENFEEELVNYFLEHSNELGFYYCPVCNYFHSEESYHHRADMCEQCAIQEGILEVNKND